MAIWLGIVIFNLVQTLGPIDYLTAIMASPDLDNLEPGPESETKRRQPDALAKLITTKENLFKGGTLRIYGDWFGEPYRNFHEIINAQFDSQESLLTINFKEGEILEIYGPEHIFEASTFLKIIRASRIRLIWSDFSKSTKDDIPLFIDYKLIKNKVKIETNAQKFKTKVDISLGQPALMIYS